MLPMKKLTQCKVMILFRLAPKCYFIGDTIAVLTDNKLQVGTIIHIQSDEIKLQ